MKQIKIKTFETENYKNNIILYETELRKDIRIMIESEPKSQDFQTRINYPIFYNSDNWALDFPEILKIDDNAICLEIRKYCFKLAEFFGMY